MKMLYFNTDITDYDQIEAIRNTLNHSLGFREWSFNLETKDSIFKVEVLTTSPEEIIDLLKRLGVSSTLI